jgi:hypothetical protein
MHSKCAWCNTEQEEVAPLDNEAVTHTICLACSLKVLNFLREDESAPKVRIVRAVCPRHRLRRRTMARISSRTFLVPIEFKRRGGVY